MQGAPQTTLSHPCAHTTNRAQHHRNQFQHHRQGGPGAGQDHQGIHLHKGKQSNFKPKHWASTISVIYGTESFLTPQGLNWALPN